VTDHVVEVAELVADLSMYTSLGINARMRGGAVRVSASKIVNIATGGGIVLSEENRRLLSGYRTVFLDTSSEHVLGKLNLSKRPLLKDNPERWDAIYSERKALYEQCATATVFTGGRSIKALISQLKQEATR
jgi:shikimate kinase